MGLVPSQERPRGAPSPFCGEDQSMDWAAGSHQTPNLEELGVRLPSLQNCEELGGFRQPPNLQDCHYSGQMDTHPLATAGCWARSGKCLHMPQG